MTLWYHGDRKDDLIMSIPFWVEATHAFSQLVYNSLFKTRGKITLNRSHGESEHGKISIMV